MNYKTKSLLVIILFFSFSCLAQKKNSDKIGKQLSSEIKDGVYFSFENVKKNQPDLLPENLFKSLYGSTFSLWQWSNTTNLYYIDKYNMKQSLNRDSIWGFSDAGTPYICINRKFHRIQTVGSISLFNESYPIIKDPLSIVVTDAKGTSADRIFDFETGKVIDYSLENFSLILARDQELFNEFNAIKKEKSKRKKAYVYLEKYNSRHPMFVK